MTKEHEMTSTAVTTESIYQTPQVLDYGSVEEVTQTNNTFNTSPDGGSYPNAYAS